MERLVKKVDAVFPKECVFVEIGSYLGRSTCCIAQALTHHKLISIDPHEGILQQPGGAKSVFPSFRRFKQNITECGVEKKIEIIRSRSEEVEWDGRPICFLFIDGWHDYKNVIRDFELFYPYMVPGAEAVFHDYGSPHYPGVKKAVDEIHGKGNGFGEILTDRYIVAFRVKIDETHK